MSKQRNIAVSSAASILIAAALTVSGPAYSGDAGAFIGGVVTSRVLTNMGRRTRAEEAQAYNSSRAQPVQQAAPAPAAPATMTTQQKLDQLNKLAAGGYITADEYKAKKKAIMDSM